MMPWSGLLIITIKHAYEMGTSELHRTSIMSAADALTTDRSMYPKGLNRRLYQIQARKNRSSTLSALADKFDCAKQLDWGGPVTEVLSLMGPSRRVQTANSTSPTQRDVNFHSVFLN